MASPEASVRQRKARLPDQDLPSEDEGNLFAGTPSEKLRADGKKNATAKTSGAGSDAEDKVARDDSYSPWLDMLRVVTFLVVACCGLSFVVSGGESWTWGFHDKPKYFRPGYWRYRLNGPIYLTPQELVQYDGTDPDKPIYLAINHTIYDVSANRRIYGPGGSYNVFAGHDASRGFVTGCFKEDRTPDMRGVEEMYLPLDDPDTDRYWGYDEFEALRATELESALQKVHDTLKHWTDFFADSDKYYAVGRVSLPEGWLDQTPQPALCEGAKKKRMRRKLPHEQEEEARKKREKKEKRKKGKKGGK